MDFAFSALPETEAPSEKRAILDDNKPVTGESMNMSSWYEQSLNFIQHVQLVLMALRGLLGDLALTVLAAYGAYRMFEKSKDGSTPPAAEQ